MSAIDSFRALAVSSIISNNGVTLNSNEVQSLLQAIDDLQKDLEIAYGDVDVLRGQLRAATDPFEPTYTDHSVGADGRLAVEDVYAPPVISEIDLTDGPGEVMPGIYVSLEELGKLIGIAVREASK